METAVNLDKSETDMTENMTKNQTKVHNPHINIFFILFIIIINEQLKKNTNVKCLKCLHYINESNQYSF